MATHRPCPTRLLLAVLLTVALGPVVAAPCGAQEEVRTADRFVASLAAGALAGPPSPVVELSLARFVGDLVELGIRQEGGFATGSGPDDWHLATAPFADLHLFRDPKPMLAPFAGLSAGALYDDRRITATLGPEAGVKLFLGGRAFAELRYQFRWSPERVGGVPTEAHVAVLGFGVLFGASADDELARTEQAAARAEAAALGAEQAVERLERAVERLERAVDQFEVWFMEQLRK